MRLLTQFHSQYKQPVQPTPKRQLFLDLQAWISSLQDQGHDIILSLDANEVYDPDSPAPRCPLVFVQGKPTICPNHNGKLATLISTCSLIDPLARQHPSRPFPASHSRGSSRIDFILISQTLYESVIRSGCLCFHSLFLRGDHRPYFLDMDPKLLFSDPTNAIEQPIGWRLCLHDPRVVEKYVTTLHDQLVYHKITEHVQTLSEAAIKGEWMPCLQTLYNTTDNIITMSMIHTDRTLGNNTTRRYQWSPQLKLLVSHFRYWILWLKSCKGASISPSRLSTAFTESLLPAAAEEPIGMPEIIKQLRDASAAMKTTRQHHIQLRQTHLESLAEAKVLQRQPSLSQSYHSANRQTATTKQLKALI